MLWITGFVILNRLRQSCYDHTRRYTVPVYVARSRPSKQGRSNQCWLNDGPPSAKLAQHVVFAGTLILRRTFTSMCETNRRGRLIKLINTIHCPIVGSMLGQRRRRLTNIAPPLGQCLVFAGRQSTVTRD